MGQNHKMREKHHNRKETIVNEMIIDKRYSNQTTLSWKIINRR